MIQDDFLGDFVSTCPGNDATGTCTDDADQFLASVGYTCESAYSALGRQCQYDLSNAGIPNIAPGTLFEDICPQTCLLCH